MHQRHRLAYERSGDGPAVVLIHALGGSRESWRRQIDQLAKGHTVLAIDLPGHGESPPASALRLGALASAIVDLLREEYLGPSTLVGHSIGGVVAAMTALEAGPSLVTGLGLVDTTLGPFPWPRTELDAIRERLQQDPRAELTRFFRRITASEAQAEAIVEGALRVPPEAFMALLEASAEEGAGSRAGELRMPVWLAAALVLGSRPTDVFVEQEGFASLSNLTVERFERSAHWPQLDEPEHFDDALRRFVSSCDPP